MVAAGQHFSRYGYDKTTVADLADAIGFSKAYIYKFFNSKQAIAEAICMTTLGSIVGDIEAAIAQAKTPTDKLRKLLETAVSNSVRLFFNDRKLYDIAAHSCGEGWSPSVAYTEQLSGLIARVLLEGRQAGEFERKTPLDDTVHGIMASMSKLPAAAAAAVQPRLGTGRIEQGHRTGAAQPFPVVQGVRQVTT